uniref:FACT complex subunit SSRP1 n=3 Tax=Schistosoma japonicum TaxID=6182 RepID=C1LE88_SCHJA|nr:structure specific recognition protein 1 [Schistosoma japonicum]
MADIAFDHITQEVRGTVYPGKLRLKEDEFMYKNEKTGKVDHFSRSDIESAQWIVRATGLGLSIKLKNNSLHRYDGFGEIEAEKVGSFFKKYFDVEVVKRELSYKGYNWGDVDFDGDVLEFSVKNAMAFEVPLSNVANATLNKNEIIFEFHLNDEAEICLSEMRLYTPGTEADREGKAPIIYSKVTQKADIIQVTGDFLIEFKQLQCLQPRGRYDVKLYPSFIHLHGKSFDFKVPKNTITRLMMLPHPDNRQIFFTVQLDPPIKHGQTRYHFVIFLFDKDSHVDLEMAATEEWLQEQFNGKLARNISGPEYEVVARVFKILYDQKVTVPGSFSAKGGGCAVACSYKASVGLLYPLERGFTFVPRPPISIRFDEIVTVQFSRGTGAQRSFDFEVETRNGLTHTFTSIERDEYHHLYDFVTAKKLRVKNISSENKTITNPGDDVWSSSDESHDAYMEKVKTEARERTAEMDDDDDDDEDDEDFKPPESDGSELAEEYDSNVQTTTSEEDSEDNDEDDDDGDADGNGNKNNARKKDKRDDSSDLDEEEADSLSSDVEPKPKQKKLKEEPKTSNRPRKDETKSSKRQTKKQEKPKDPNAPTRPLSAYFLWFNENREKIAKSLSGQNSVAEVAKAGGELWRNMDSETKSTYQSRVDELKKKYQEDLRVYQSNLSSKERELSSDSS